jgi:hypothetical protein
MAITYKTFDKPLNLASVALAMARRETVTEPLKPSTTISTTILNELVEAAEGVLDHTHNGAFDRLREAVEDVKVMIALQGKEE